MNEMVLCHHGIKGQKWGVRRYQNEDGTLTPAGRRRAEMDAAKAEYKTAKSEYHKSAGKFIKSYPIIGKMKKAQDGYGDAYAKMVSARAKVKASKYEDQAKRDKAEKNTYVKALTRGGLPKSINDTKNYKVSTALVKNLRTEKGEAYTNSVLKSAKTKLYSTVAIGSTVAVGATAVASYLAIKKVNPWK